MTTKTNTDNSKINFSEINSYSDLLEEKQRLKDQLQANKLALKQSFQELKDEVNPIKKVAETVKDVWNADAQSPIIGLGVSKVSQLLLDKFLLKKAGWITKLVVPFAFRKIGTYIATQQTAKKAASVLHDFADTIRDADLKPGPGK